jgi:glyoxylase-like metal-dependent hydrolase (beta-lactamase superfamily II)
MCYHYKRFEREAVNLIHTISVGMVNTNCYIVSDAQTGDAAVIDPGGGADKILEYLRRESLTVRYIFLTHGHFDHILALEKLRQDTGAPSVIHKADAAYLNDPSLSSPFGVRVTPSEPDIAASHGDTYQLGGQTVEVLHTPGHTPGSICLRIGDALFTGDTLFEDDCGRCDLPGGDYKAMLNSLRLLALLDGDYHVYPGHDVSTTLERERTHNVNMREALLRA